MKQLTCEMCGSTDLLKQDGVFVCQSCGCKYSVEEAKKMMIEGTVDVQGTVKIDISEKLQNLYQVARRAKEDNDDVTAAKYYDMILAEDPTSWEASFYSVYFRSMSCTIAKIPSAASSVSKCLPSVLTLIKQSGSNEEETQAAVKEVYEKATNAATLFLRASANSFCNIRTDHPARFVPDLSARCFAAAEVAYATGMAIDNVFGDKSWAQRLVSSAYSTGNTLLSTFVSVMKPKSFLETAAIHGDMETRANNIMGEFRVKSSQAISKERKLLAEEERIAAEKREKQKQVYWEQHAEEKAKLDREQSELKLKMDELNTQIAAIDEKNTAKINELSKERDKKLPCEVEVDKQRDLIRDLEAQRDKCGIFKGKEKKAIQSRLDAEEYPKLENLQRKADVEKKAHQEKYTAEINVIKGEGKELRDEVANLKKRSDEITEELTKDR